MLCISLQAQYIIYDGIQWFEGLFHIAAEFV